MLTFDIEKFTPRFILNDKNGYALARAIQAGLDMMNSTIRDGVMCVKDADSMPEWRLDEMAREYSIPYDYTAPVEVKRRWIGEAYALSRSYGTPSGIQKYLKGYYDDAKILEASEYGGEPFHFAMEIDGEWTQAKQMWVIKAINETKNVRSVLDSIKQKLPDITARHELFVGLALYGAVHQWLGRTEMPDISGDYLYDEMENTLMDEWGVALTE